MSKKSKTPSQEFMEKASLAAAKEAQEMLYEAEEYMACANILIFLKAIKMTPEIYRLKTVQKNFNKILDHYNEAAEELDKVGLKETLKELNEENGTNFELEGVDIKKLFDTKPIKMRL